jgi:hypothetical protein
MYRAKTGDIRVGPAVLLRDRPDVRLDAFDLPEGLTRLVLPPTAPPIGMDGEPVLLDTDSLGVSIHAESGPHAYRFLDHTRFVVEGNEFALFGPDPNLNDEWGESLFLSGQVEDRPWVRQRVLAGTAEVLLRFESGAWLSGSILTDPSQGAVGYIVDFYCMDAGA